MLAFLQIAEYRLDLQALQAQGKDLRVCINPDASNLPAPTVCACPLGPAVTLADAGKACKSNFKVCSQADQSSKL